MHMDQTDPSWPRWMRSEHPSCHGLGSRLCACCRAGEGPLTWGNRPGYTRTAFWHGRLSALERAKPPLILLHNLELHHWRRAFKIKALEVSGAAQKLTEGLSGKRDLAKLSPWLAEYSAASGKSRGRSLCMQCLMQSMRWRSEVEGAPHSGSAIRKERSLTCNDTLRCTGDVEQHSHTPSTTNCVCSVGSGIVQREGCKLGGQCTEAELGGPLLMPWMPSMGGVSGSLPPEVRVVGFGKQASVFSSKQKPKELSIYGSDFRYLDMS